MEGSLEGSLVPSFRRRGKGWLGKQLCPPLCLCVSVFRKIPFPSGRGLREGFEITVGKTKELLPVVR